MLLEPPVARERRLERHDEVGQSLMSLLAAIASSVHWRNATHSRMAAYSGSETAQIMSSTSYRVVAEELRVHVLLQKRLTAASALTSLCVLDTAFLSRFLSRFHPVGSS